MRRGTWLGALGLALALLWWVRQRWAPEDAPPHRPKDAARVEPSPVCPWRNPALDLKALFPSTTDAALDTRIVTGLTVPIQKRLGRPLRPDENPLRIHRVRHEGQTRGSVVVTRVKGEHGGIELVTAVETNGVVRGVRIQSQREPPAVAAVITNAAWLAGFAGKTATSAFRLGADLPEVPAEARASAEAIAHGARDQLIVLGFAEMPREARELGQLPSP